MNELRFDQDGSPEIDPDVDETFDSSKFSADVLRKDMLAYERAQYRNQAVGYIMQSETPLETGYETVHDMLKDARTIAEYVMTGDIVVVDKD